MSLEAIGLAVEADAARGVWHPTAKATDAATLMRLAAEAGIDLAKPLASAPVLN